MKVVDKNGEWLQNGCVFSFTDPDPQGSGVTFEPGEPVRIKVVDGSWVAIQKAAGVLVASADPTREDPPAGEEPKGKSKGA